MREGQVDKVHTFIKLIIGRVKLTKKHSKSRIFAFLERAPRPSSIKMLEFSLFGCFAIWVQLQPVNATPPRVFEFERITKTDFKIFEQLCKIENLRRYNIRILSIGYFNLYQNKNECIKGKRAIVCKTYALNLQTNQCLSDIYISSHGYLEENSNYEFPAEFDGKFGPNPPIVFEGEGGTVLLFSNERTLVTRLDE